MSETAEDVKPLGTALSAIVSRTRGKRFPFCSKPVKEEASSKPLKSCGRWCDSPLDCCCLSVSAAGSSVWKQVPLGQGHMLSLRVVQMSPLLGGMTLSGQNVLSDLCVFSKVVFNQRRVNPHSGDQHV